MNVLRSVAGYTRRGQTRNAKIWKELNIFDLNNKILKSRSHWKYHVLQIKKQMNFKENVNIQPKHETKHRAPTVKTDGPTSYSRGRNRPSMA
jgi:ribonucleotide reductase alpha subunit